MTASLNIASKQLFSRPDDECYSSWAGLLSYLGTREKLTRELTTERRALQPWAAHDALCLHDSEARETHHLTDWSFRQLCRLYRAPADFINRLSPASASKVLIEAGQDFWGENDDKARVLIERDRLVGIEGTARAIYTEDYARVPDLTVARLVHQEATGFVPAGEVAGRHVGMPPVKPDRTGLYAGDRDMFLFLADEDRPIEWKPKGNGGSGGAFYRFIIVRNSETAARKIGLIMGLCEGICGNHLIWGAEEVIVWERRHVGDPEAILEYLRRSIEALRDRGSIHKELAVLQAAAETAFASTKDDFTEKLYPDVTKQIAGQAWDSALVDFSATVPLSVWNTVQGLTRVSQTIGYQERRTEIDQVAGKLLAAVQS